jgi:glycine hydroxymethyltransferase
MAADEMRRIAAWILRVLKAPQDAAVVETTRREVAELAAQFPVPAARLEEAVAG